MNAKETLYSNIYFSYSYKNKSHNRLLKKQKTAKHMMTDLTLNMCLCL